MDPVVKLFFSEAAYQSENKNLFTAQGFKVKVFIKFIPFLFFHFSQGKQGT